MIAPDQRLLWCVALVAVPLCAIAGIAPALGWPCAAGLAAFAVLLALDALRSRSSVTVTAPAALQWFKDRTAPLTVQVSNASRGTLQLRLYVALPASIHAEPEVISSVIGSRSAFEIACTPTARGRFTVSACHVETRSPFGFWRVRRTVPVQSEIRVYPDLRHERGAELLLTHRQIGMHNQRQVGKGREFEKLREYMHGDGFDEIHWKASARHGRPVVKVFQVERTQEIYTIVDASRLSARENILERYVNASLAIAVAAESQGDHFGLVTFSAGVDRFVRAASGKQHFSACREAIYAVEPRRVSPDFEELFTFLQLRLRRRALLLFLTSLDDPVLAESFSRDVRILKRHLIVVNVPSQEHVRPLFSGPAPADVDAIYEDLAGHMQWTRLRELQKTLERSGVTLAVEDPQTLTANLARRYFTIKQRQLL